MKPAFKNKRQTAERKGKTAELKAKLYLRLKGYRVLSERYKTKVGEIDLIAKRGTTLVFVEVKARKSVDDAAHAISYKQRKRIERAAEQWIKSHRYLYSAIRFDMIAVTPFGWPTHMTNAWRPET